MRTSHLLLLLTCVGCVAFVVVQLAFLYHAGARSLEDIVPEPLARLFRTDETPHATCQPRVNTNWHTAQCPPLCFDSIQRARERSRAVHTAELRSKQDSQKLNAPSKNALSDSSDGKMHPVLMDAFPHILDGQAVFVVGIDYVRLVEILNDTEWSRLQKEHAGAFFAHYRYHKEETDDDDVTHDDDHHFESIYCSIPDEFPDGARWHHQEYADELFNFVVRCPLPRGYYHALHENKLAVMLEHVTETKLRHSIRNEGARCYEPIMLCLHDVGDIAPDSNSEPQVRVPEVRPVDLLPLQLPEKPVALAVCAIVRHTALEGFPIPFYSAERALSEWMAMASTLMGVQHFFLYDTSSTQSQRLAMRRWLKPWQDNGVVTYVPWNFRPNQTRSSSESNPNIESLSHRHYAQVPAYDDCLWRFRPFARWFALMDTDELILARSSKEPHKPENLLAVLEEYDNTTVAGFNFAGAFWGLESELEHNKDGGEDFLLSARLTRRERECTASSKSIVKATQVCASGVYYPFCTLQPMIEFGCNQPPAQLVHYRRDDLVLSVVGNEEKYVTDQILANMQTCIRAAVTESGKWNRKMLQSCPRRPRVSAAAQTGLPWQMTTYGALMMLVYILFGTWAIVRLLLSPYCSVKLSRSRRFARVRAPLGRLLMHNNDEKKR